MGEWVRIKPTMKGDVLKCQTAGGKAFAEWAQVFAGDAVMASAALDRLPHRARR